MEIVHSMGREGASRARGTVIVIDVLRSFTVSAFALAGGARECLLVPTVAEAVRLAEQIPESVICAEEEGLPVKGIAISNSPTLVLQAQLAGRTLIQRSSAGTPVMAAVPAGRPMFAASLVVARATAQACLLRRPRTVTLIASADFIEDHACARYLEALLQGDEVDLEGLLQPLRASERYRRFASGEWPGFPRTDLELSLSPNRFDFAMPVKREASYLRLTRIDPAGGC